MYGNNNFYSEGVSYFKKEEFEKAKFKFEQDIVFHPKNENSYLYLAKIFKLEDKLALANENLNTVILLNPKNEEAIYHLAKLKLKNSDYEGVKELLKKFGKVCSKLCNKSEEIKKELQLSLKK